MDEAVQHDPRNGRIDDVIGRNNGPDIMSPLLVKLEPTYSDYEKQKWRIWKNVLALVGGVGIFTMGLNPIDDLQSSLNSEGGLGVASLGVKYAFMILGNLLTNTLIIRKLGPKVALVWGTLLYGIYIVANFYPTWATLIPLTVLAGLGGALMWTTLGHYLATLAQHMALLRNSNPDSVKALFFGFKGIIGYTFAAFGGLASSLILSTGVHEEGPPKYTNVPGPSRYSICGASYCNEDLQGIPDIYTSDVNSVFRNGTSQMEIPHNGYSESIYVLCGFCTVAAALGVLVMVCFVDPLPKLGIKNKDEGFDSGSPFALLSATVRLWRTKTQLLLIPITLVYGLQEAFWRVEFSKAYITCAMGMQHIGFLMVCYNVASLLSSFTCGWLGQRRTRLVAFPVLIVVDAMALTSMLYWKPTPDGAATAYLVTAVTGTTYGALSTLILALYGIVFPNDLEAAYSNLYFWCFLGSTLMYATSYSLCLRVKLFIVLAVVLMGLVGYLSTEVTLQSSKNRSRKSLTNNNLIHDGGHHHHYAPVDSPE